MHPREVGIKKGCRIGPTNAVYIQNREDRVMMGLDLRSVP